MEAVVWSVEGKQAENCLDRLRLLCHQMDSSGGLIKAVAGAEIGRSDKFFLITFWKAWDNVTRYLGGSKSDMLPKLGSPHHFEVVWQFPKEEAAASHTGSHVVVFDVYAQEKSVEPLLEHLLSGVSRLSHEPNFESAALWIDKTNAEHMLLATHWAGDKTPDSLHIDGFLRLDEDVVHVAEKSVTVYKMHELNPAARV